MADIITPNFDLLSRFDPTAGVEMVRIGANANVLESEFNEFQQIAETRFRNLLRFVYADGLSTLSNMTYAAGTFSINNCYAMVDGVLIYISTSTIAAASGNNIYLDTWVSTESYASTLRKYGNVQETTVTNYMKDSIIGLETSRREIRHYALSTNNLQANHNYLLLGQIVTGALVKKANLIKSNLSALQTKQEDTFISTAGQTVFTLTSGAYTPGKGQVEIFLNGIRISRSAFTETSSTVITLKANNIPAGMEVSILFG